MHTYLTTFDDVTSFEFNLLGFWLRQFKDLGLAILVLIVTQVQHLWMSTLCPWGQTVERLVFLRFLHLFAQFVNLLLLSIILLLEEFPLFWNIALVILKVPGFHQFIADFTLCFQYGTLPPIISAAQCLKKLVFVGGQMSAQLLVTQLFELAL